MPVTRWRRVAQRRIHPIDGPGTVRQSPEATHKVNAGAAEGRRRGAGGFAVWRCCAVRKLTRNVPYPQTR